MIAVAGRGFCSKRLMVRMGRLTGKYKEGMENLTFSGSFRFMMGDGTHFTFGRMFGAVTRRPFQKLFHTA